MYNRAGYIRVSKDTNIMIGETFMDLKASLFDHHHSLHPVLEMGKNKCRYSPSPPM